MQMNELRANLAIVLRGDLTELKAVLCRLEESLNESPSVRVVHKHVSASRLWVNEGDDMNETGT